MIYGEKKILNKGFYDIEYFYIIGAFIYFVTKEHEDKYAIY